MFISSISRKVLILISVTVCVASISSIVPPHSSTFANMLLEGVGEVEQNLQREMLLKADSHLNGLKADSDEEHGPEIRLSYIDLAVAVDRIRANRTYDRSSLTVPDQLSVDNSENPIPVDQLIADGQFVWGPNVGTFDVHDYLSTIESPLVDYADEIQGWLTYTSINPRVFLAYLETCCQLVTAPAYPPDSIPMLIQDSALQMSLAFYQHLYTWGRRSHKSASSVRDIPPALIFEDGKTVQSQPTSSSGSFAVTALLAEKTTITQLPSLLNSDQMTGFSATFQSMFPDVNLLDESNQIDPLELPADDLFQLPFALGASWTFSGAHSWYGGGDYPDRSSIDFSYPWPDFPDAPRRNVVAAASGTGYIYTPSNPDDPIPCWVRLDHGNGWSTSYYHLTNVGGAGSFGLTNSNEILGSTGVGVCNYGFASGPHVHFTLWYNGALFDLEDVKLSGWNVNPDFSCRNNCYSSGTLTRDGTTINPWTWIENDYHQYFSFPNMSVRFYGNGADDIDRAVISVDSPEMPVDIGDSDFTIEFWLKANLEQNSSPICIDAGDRWRLGNMILDRDIYAEPEFGDFGISMSNGKIAFGVNNGYSSKTVCSSTLVADGQWHHIAITRRFQDGNMRIFIDGVKETEAFGPRGNLSYKNMRATGYPRDPFIVLGAEKHDLGTSNPSLNGWVDDLRISDFERYDADFSLPGEPLENDSHTLGLYTFDINRSDTLIDTSGVLGGPSNGTVLFGGSPAGPIFTYDVPGDSEPVLPQQRLVYRLPTSIQTGTNNRMWLTTSNPGVSVEPLTKFRYVVFLHIPEDWQLPWARQFNNSGVFPNTTLSRSLERQSWISSSGNCQPVSGPASQGYKWRVFEGPEQTMPGFGDPYEHITTLKGGISIPDTALTDQFDDIRVVVGVELDTDQDGETDSTSCQGIHLSGTWISASP